MGKRAREKIDEFLLLVRRICPTSPIGVASTPRFAFKHKVQHSAKNISCALNIMPILLTLRCSHSRLTILPEIVYYLGGQY
jgi:hypothetical protein